MTIRGRAPTAPPNPAELVTAASVAYGGRGPREDGEGEPVLYPELVQPLDTFIHLQIIREDVTQGGLYLPETAASGGGVESCKALVVAVGPKCEQLKRGDKVLLFPSMAAGEVGYRGMRLLQLYEDRVCGKVLEHESVVQQRLERSAAAFNEQS